MRPSDKDASVSEVMCGAVAQLGERVVRNDEVRGSIPLSSTKHIFFDIRYFRDLLTACQLIGTVPSRTIVSLVRLHISSGILCLISYALR